MPEASVCLPLLRTYTWLAGSSPTSTTARPGLKPCSRSSACTRVATRSRNFAANALPSIRFDTVLADAVLFIV